MSESLELIKAVLSLPGIFNRLETLERKIMAGVTALDVKLKELTDTIASEKQEVSDRLGNLEATINDLKAKVETQAPEVNLDAEIAAVDEAIAAVKGIVEPATPAT